MGLIKHASQYMSRAVDERMMRARVDRKHKRLVDRDATVHAYVNHGRWVADCACGSGMAVDHEWQRAYCVACGQSSKVKWPNRMAAIAAVLAFRPTSASNWEPGETVAQLRAENIEHGLEGGA